MSFQGHTIEYSLNEIKSKTGYDNSKFANLLISYMNRSLGVSIDEIKEKLNLFNSYMNDK